jgi:ribosomal-protein-alanine N-acetyltransferase
MIDIIKMNEGHIHQVAELEKACFASPWSVESFYGELHNPLSVLYVAVTQNIVVGYISMQHIIDEGFIANLAVATEYRNNEIARALILKLVEYAKENKLSFLTLEVRKSNSAAIHLYTSTGFVTEGERRNFYEHPKEDAFIMTKRFNFV